MNSRIVVGTPHEKVAVLTRQDWRHTKGRPWGPDSNGHWELEVATAGEYDVRLRFPPAEAAGEATLDLNDKTLSTGLRAGAEDDGIPCIAFQYSEYTGQFQQYRDQAGTFSDSIKLWGGDA